MRLTSSARIKRAVCHSNKSSVKCSTEAVTMKAWPADDWKVIVIESPETNVVSLGNRFRVMGGGIISISVKPPSVLEQRP